MNRLLPLCSLGALFLAAIGPTGSATEAKPAPFLEILPQPVLTGMIHLPGLLVTQADTALIIAQSRLKRGDRDPSDVVLTRSTDQGRTWSAPIKLFESGNSGQIGYSCVLVEDRKASVVLAYYTVAPTPWKPEQLVWYGRRSSDDGKTWSEPFAVKHDGDPESKPSNGGHGFQFSTGRLVLPGRGNFLYSDDGGMSWSTVGKTETVETKVLPVYPPGSAEARAVYIITRRATTYRIYDNYGEKLLEQGDHGNEFTTLGRNPGLARYSTKTDPSGSVLLMSGIHDMKNRVFGLTYSRDEGRTWSERKTIDRLAWYSDIGVLRDKTILVAYTVGFSEDLKVARLNLPWMLQK